MSQLLSLKILLITKTTVMIKANLLPPNGISYTKIKRIILIIIIHSIIMTLLHLKPKLLY